VILRVTLSPGGSGAAPPPWCLVCGDHVLADAIRNILLFLPLGLLLRLGGPSLRTTVGVAAVLSLAVELIQTLIPGRDPSVTDLASNTLGAVAGAWAAGLPRDWWVPGPARAARLAIGWSAAVVLMLAAGRSLLAPSLPVAPYYGQWVAQLGHLAWYGGSVRQARLGTRPLPDGPLGASRLVRASLLAGDTLVVEAMAGPLTRALAPVFSIADDRGREIVLAGADGEDLVVRYRTGASAIRLEQPRARFPRAFRGVRGGADLAIRVWRIGPGVCMELNGRRLCPGPDPTRGWSFIVPEQWLDAGKRNLADVLWTMALVLPACYWLVLALWPAGWRPAVGGGSDSGGTGR